MNPRHLAWSKERDTEINVTNLPHGITIDNKRGKHERLRFNESLPDIEHLSSHFTYNLGRYC